MMKAVIIDDEQDAILTLELIIQEYFSELNIVGKFTDPAKALSLLPHLKPDLVFLDINMPGMNGFELLQNLKNKDFHIVFTTAYDEYALKAFKYNAVDYLLKPIDVEELVNTINRLKTRSNPHRASNLDYRKLLNDIYNKNEEKLAFPTADGIYFIKPTEILYFLASGSYTKVIRKEGDIIFVSKTLKDFEDKIGPEFYRIHKSYTINLKYVKMLIKLDGWSIMMDNGDKIPISRRKRMDISNLVSRISGEPIE
jgi:two-component system, LytTR family, response regulator